LKTGFGAAGGGAEATCGADLIGKFWFVDHGAGIAALGWGLNQRGMVKMSGSLLTFSKLASSIITFTYQ
jgi:hypothetical protein